jgi:UDP-N-acetylmuramoylalanine--D-glutamate ligase
MFENKKIFILGMARSGYEAAKLLATKNNKIIVNDSKEDQNEEHVRELMSLGVEVVLGSHPEELLTKDIDFIIKNPGIRNDHVYVQKAKEYNIPVINEVEMAYLLMPKDITLIGITGSNGKTTTTSLIYEIIKSVKPNVHLTGNIGFPLSAFVDRVKPKDIVVMEVSVQQLCNVDKFKTNISVLTNFYEAHLDFVGNYENYMNIKKRIFNHHTNKDYAILNYDNKDVLKITNDIKSQKKYFSRKENIDCHMQKDDIYYLDEFIISARDLLLKGAHNYENVMAAINVAKILKVDTKDIVKVLKEFKGVEHRIEFVRELKGRTFYNDSKSTNVVATQTALSSFNNPTILLLGGLDRGHLFDELKGYMSNVKLVICYGETKDRIKSFCDSINIECKIFDTLKESTKEAYKESSEGDVILLSPACASWDQYKDFEERGKEFKTIVNKL